MTKLTDAEIADALRPFFNSADALDFSLRNCMDEYRAIEQAVLSKQAKEPLIVKEALTGMVDAQIQAHFGRPTGGIEP